MVLLHQPEDSHYAQTLSKISQAWVLRSNLELMMTRFVTTSLFPKSEIAGYVAISGWWRSEYLENCFDTFFPQVQHIIQVWPINRKIWICIWKLANSWCHLYDTLGHHWWSDEMKTHGAGSIRLISRTINWKLWEWFSSINQIFYFQHIHLFQTFFG